jgi:FkbM family methyltransferase
MIEQYIIQAAKFATFTPRVSLEIGAYDGEYSRELMSAFCIAAENVCLVEPNPRQYAQLVQDFPRSRTLQYAIADVDGSMSFNAVTNRERNKRQCSSLMQRVDDWSKLLSYETVEVRTITGAQLLQEVNSPVDLCIVDVEGMTLEVLRSFGAGIETIKSFMLECEHVPIFRGQHLFDEVAGYLRDCGFQMMAFQYAYPQQSDSVWIHERYLDLASMRPLPDYYDLSGTPYRSARPSATLQR